MTEEVAIELTGRALRDDGFDLAELQPMEIGTFNPAFPDERILARNLYNSNDWRLTWRAIAHRFEGEDSFDSYNVNFEKRGMRSYVAFSGQNDLANDRHR